MNLIFYCWSMIIQNYFPGVERHAGDIDVPGGGDNFALLLPLQVKIPAPPRLGGLHWLVH
jgi:hypothetical protein